MTLNRPRSKSQNFRIRYLEYHERYNVKHNGDQIGNHEWAFG